MLSSSPLSGQPSIRLMQGGENTDFFCKKNNNMKDKKRAFKGVWIPKEVWLDEELSLQEKCFLVEIDSLDNEDGCFAGNEYFSGFFGISKDRCKRVISELQSKGRIIVELDRSEENNAKRTIRSLGLKATHPVGAETTHPSGRKHRVGRGGNNPYNNTSNNTDNNICESNDSRKKEIQELMDIFYQFNPALKFGNKTERKACEEMIEKWDFEKVKSMALKVISVQGTDKFAPRASTPSKMWNKIAEFAAYFKAGAKTGKVVRRA